ncbi:hypothetical protein BDV93DRAFT_589916 [Ceratobasidium sp. AG-I]|nr:hypothetical protein BDV93DRAFT_589916 [Ceratobasidium sp. AG-I]
MPAQTRSTTQRTTRSSTKQKSKTAVVTSDSSKAVPIGKNKPSGRGGTKKVSPPVKRARHASPEADTEVVTAPKRTRGKRGKLEAFMNLPIEIFPEIAIYLFPLDLVVLARTNKFFRQLLMRRSAIQIWRSAEGNVDGLPPCPKDLCGPQYAALMFTKNCSVCPLHLSPSRLQAQIL